MRTMKIFWAMVFAASLIACTIRETQLFIFKRYNSETGRWSYYKTDLYALSRIEQININPCFLEDNRVQPVWSPNGKYYGCPTVADQPLGIYDIKNETLAMLEQENAKDPLRWWIAGWSPDSQYVSIINTGSLEHPYHDFSIMKYDGTEIYQVYTHPAALFNFGDWSPNGKFVVLEVTPYENGQSVLIVFDSSGKELDQFNLSKLTHTNMFLAEFVKWSPDSKKLAFLTAYNTSVDSKLYVLDIESGELADVIPHKSLCIMSISDWSPDSKKILFDAIDCEKHVSGDIFDHVYYSINADGSELVPLTEKGLGLLNWTLDGKSLIVSGYGEKSMFIMNADGSDKRILLDDGYFVSWIKP